MSLSEIIIKIIGIILAFVGIALLLAAVGLTFLFGVGLGAWYWNVLVGVIFLGAGIYIIRGGNISL
jgi:hypothetical protein